MSVDKMSVDKMSEYEMSIDKQFQYYLSSRASLMSATASMRTLVLEPII